MIHKQLFKSEGGVRQIFAQHDVASFPKMDDASSQNKDLFERRVGLKHSCSKAACRCSS
jgi:hypothetical protein